MNNTELEALRRLLFLSQAEAAVIAGVTDRTWRYWESGQKPVPNDVEDELYRLADYRDTAIFELHKQIDAGIEAHGDDLDVVLIWYGSVEDWLSKDNDPALWRPHCSAVADIFKAYDCLRLIKFDLKSYHAWLAGREDSVAMLQEPSFLRRVPDVSG